MIYMIREIAKSLFREDPDFGSYLTSLTSRTKNHFSFFILGSYIWMK